MYILKSDLERLFQVKKSSGEWKILSLSVTVIKLAIPKLIVSIVYDQKSWKIFYHKTDLNGTSWNPKKKQV